MGLGDFGFGDMVQRVPLLENIPLIQGPISLWLYAIPIRSKQHPLSAYCANCSSDYAGRRLGDFAIGIVKGACKTNSLPCVRSQ